MTLARTFGRPALAELDWGLLRRVTGATVDGEARWSALMAAAQHGNGLAYATLLRDCIPLIRAVAVGVGVSSSNVEDVIQDVLLAIHRVRHTYDPAQPFKPWLRVIAQRRAIDSLRRAGRRREIHAPLDYECHPDPGSGANAAAERSDDGSRLRHAVAGLPAGQRQAVELLGLKELSLEEAALLTGRSKTALKVNLHRALKTLRLRLGDRD